MKTLIRNTNGKIEKFKFNYGTTLVDAVQELEEISYNEEDNEWTDTSGNCPYDEIDDTWDWCDYSYCFATYDVVFNDEDTNDCHGWNASIEYCKHYIETTNGTNESYFEDYKGGSVSIVCNETGEVMYKTAII